MPFAKDAPKDGNKKITEMLSAEKYPNTTRKDTGSEWQRKSNFRLGTVNSGEL